MRAEADDEMIKWLLALVKIVPIGIHPRDLLHWQIPVDLQQKFNEWKLGGCWWPVDAHLCCSRLTWQLDWSFSHVWMAWVVVTIQNSHTHAWPSVPQVMGESSTLYDQMFNVVASTLRNPTILQWIGSASKTDTIKKKKKTLHHLFAVLLTILWIYVSLHCSVSV